MLWLLAAVALWYGVVWWIRRLLEREPRLDAVPDDPGGPDPSYDLHLGAELDLHGVAPRDVPELVLAFVEMACERGYRQVEIVHGKGRGVRRRQVRALLARHPRVLACRDAATPGSGWGATIVHLRDPGDDVAPRPGSD